MLKQLRIATISILVMTVLTGLAYPLVMTGLAQALFPKQANGSLIIVDGQAVGSELIGQQFSDPKYFWGRLSATRPYPYNAASSGGSNLGPTNRALIDEVQRRVNALRAADPGNNQPIPVDLVTSSGSGLDPEISPAAAEFQAARVARLRGLPLNTVQQLINENTKGRLLGIFGEARVNVLELNLALDKLR